MSAVLLRILIVLLPVAAFLAWRYFAHRRALARGGPGLDLTEGPWGWLWIAGLMLAILSFFALPSITGEEPGGTYVPARFEDGKVIPGHIER